MTSLRKAAEEYLTLRRHLGFKLQKDGKELLAFVAFMAQYSFSDFEGSSIYHGMNLRVQKQTSHGLQFIVAYTVSKLISSPFVGQTSRQTVDPIHYSKSGNIGGRAGEIAFGGGGGYGVTYQDRDNLKVDLSISPKTFRRC